MGKASTKAQNRYIAKAYDRVNLTLPKGQKEVVQAHATARSESVNGFIGRAITEAMERDSSGTPQESRQNAPESAAGAVVVSLPSETVEAAQRAAEATGEATEQFISRAVGTQAERDKSSLRLGINPATGGKLEKEA